MKRRPFLLGLATTAVGALPIAQDSTDDIRRFVESFYRTYSTSGSAEQYRALLAPNYLLLENGKILDAEADVSSMPSPNAGTRRTDTFEFREVSIAGDTAYAVYVLHSVITDAQGAHQKAWLESMVLRRLDGRWRAVLLHSTPIVQPANLPRGSR